MDEVINEINYIIRRQEDISYTYNSLKSILERYSSILESSSLNCRENSTETDLMTLSRHFIQTENKIISVLFLNLQCDSENELIYSTLIQDVIHLFTYLDQNIVKLATSEIVNIAHKISTIACQEGQSNLLIRPLVKVSLLFTSQHNHLNSVDADILQCCISAHMYSFASSFLSSYQFDNVDPRISPILPVDILRFYYYSGIISISSKNYRHALEQFDQVISFPATHCSAVVIEAYKKSILINLIENHKKYQIPSYASHIVTRIHKIQESLSLYTLLADAYVDDNYELLASILNNEENSIQFRTDGNFGLVKQVIESLFIYRITRLSTIYSTITLDGLLNHINRHIPDDQKRFHNTKEIENTLCELFSQKKLFGVIQQSTGIVTFLEENKDLGDVLQELNNSLYSSLSTYNTLKSYQNDILLSNKLISTTLSSHFSSTVVNNIYPSGKNGVADGFE